MLEIMTMTFSKCTKGSFLLDTDVNKAMYCKILAVIAAHKALQCVKIESELVIHNLLIKILRCALSESGILIQFTSLYFIHCESKAISDNLSPKVSYLCIRKKPT